MSDRAFAPTVLLGLGSAALTAVAAGQDWARTTGKATGVDVTAASSGADTAPLALALALVTLAAWGALLVLRGRVRRMVAVLGAGAAVGVLLAVASAFGKAQNDSRAAVVAKGSTGDVFVSTLTAWYWVAVVAALVTAGAFITAALRSPSWPEMGSRYDAPGARRAADTDEDLWRALDRGRDPTA